MNKVLWSIFFFYFATHIPITLTLDLQVVFGQYYPETLQNLANWYVDTYKDYLVGNGPTWFSSFIWAELLFQLPFFFVAVYGLWYRENWIRIPSIIYGAHVATTVWAIIADLLLSDKNSTQEKITLFGFYFPYFLIPALLMLYMAINPEPFPKKKKGT